MAVAIAHWVTTILVADPDTGALVEIAVYKHPNGGLFALDGSWLTSDLPQLLDPTDADSAVLIPDPFSPIATTTLTKASSTTTAAAGPAGGVVVAQQVDLVALYER